MSLTLDTIVAIATLVLVVTGLFLIFGLLHVINLAHTGLMAVGVYAEWSFRHHGMPFWPSVFLAALVTGAAGAVIEVVVIRRLYARPLDTILATWGLSLVLVQGITEIYGATQRFLDLPTVGATDVLGTPYSNYRLIIVLLACGLLASLALIVRFTTVGLTIRAVMTNEPLARSHGINTVRVRQLTFITGRGARRVRRRGARADPGRRPELRRHARRDGLSRRPPLGPDAPRVSSSPASCSGRSATLYARYENAVWANAVVIGVAVIILRFRPQGLALRRS